MEQLPKDPIMLLSFINTKLRNHYRNLDELCQDMDADKENLKERLAAVDYHYDEGRNQFI